MTARLKLLTDTPPRAILYLRQSVAKEESISLTLQETAARDYCARMGYTVVGVKADPGISGRTWKRRAVQEVMSAIESREADVIVLWRWSRLSRNRKDWALASDRVDVAGGRIESATEPNDTATATGRFARGVMVELAAFESDRIGEVWKEVHANRIARGLPTGRLPWGWRHTNDGIEPHPDQAPAIPHLYDMYLRGAGAQQLATWLERHGYLTYYGKSTWNRATVTTILESPIHSGQVIRHGEVHPGAHEPIVDVDTWNKYMATRKVRAAERAARHRYLLSGILTCATCGEPMSGIANHHGKRSKTSYFAYRCATVSAQRGHGPASVSAALIDNGFHQWLTEYAKGIDNPNDSATADDTLEAERLAREVAAIDSQITQLTIQLGAGIIPPRAYQSAVEHHETRRAALSTALTAIETTITITPDAPHSDARQLLHIWDEAPIDGRRTGIRRIVKSIHVHHGEGRHMVIQPRKGSPVVIAL